MKFVKIDKEKFKPTKNSVKELIFLAYLSFILFICTEVMSAMGTTSYGYIENIDLYLGTGILFILLGLIIFVFKKDEKKYYIGGFIVFLIMMPFMKYAWDKFFAFLDVPDENIWCLLLDYLIILVMLSPAIFLKKKVFYKSLISAILILLSIANYFISIFRGIPLAYSDIYCIGDALSLTKSFLGDNSILFISAGVTVLITCLVFLFIKEKRGFRISSYSNIVVFVILAIGTYSYYLNLINTKTLIYYSANMVKTYRYNGYVYSTLESGLRFIRFKPKDYNEDSIMAIRKEVDSNTTSSKKATLASTKLTNISSNETKKPNILFVQLEGFMDPMAIKGVMYTKDPIPNFRKLQKEGIYGKMKTPSIGGGTARTEFEVMTGIDLEFLTDGEVPHYTILGHETLNSVASTLKKQGYSTHAIHNNQGNFYNRNKAYSSLGYDTYTSVEYMDNVERTETNWAKDTVLSEYIKECLGSTEGNDLVFTISVEGHSPYPTDADKYDLPLKVVNSSLSESDKNQIYYYINKIHETDEFIGDVVDLVDSMDEDTIVVFYGDHTPALDLLNRDEGGVDRTTTPYAIYSNFDLDTNFKGGDISAYQMSTIMLSLAGVDLGPMENVHKTLSSEKDYKKYLELIQYDILFGEDYYLSEDEKTTSSNLKMGTKDIKIKSATVQGNQICIKGKNFTRKSVVFINGKEENTMYVNKNTLRVYYDKDDIDSIDDIVVKQIGLHNIPLSQTNSIKLSN